MTPKIDLTLVSVNRSAFFLSYPQGERLVPSSPCNDNLSGCSLRTEKYNKREVDNYPVFTFTPSQSLPKKGH